MNLLILILLLLPIFLVLKFYGQRRKYPPGPVPLPLVGNMLGMQRHAPHTTLFEWFKKYGPVYTIWMATKPVIVINDYNLIKEYFVKKGDMISGRDDNIVFDLFGGGKFGLIIADGPLWKEQRRFALHTLRDFGFGKAVMESKIQDQIDALLEHIEILFQEQGNQTEVVIDPAEPLKLTVGNIILSTILGITYGKDDPTFAIMSEVSDSFGRVRREPVTFLLNSFRFLAHVPLFSHFNKDKVVRDSKIFYEWAEKRLQENKSKFNANIDTEPTNFAQAFLMEMKRRQDSGEDQGYFTDWQLMSALGDLYIAGMETTVTTLRWAIIYLIHHPEMQSKVQQEIDSVVGPNNRVKMTDRTDLPYTTAFITETQRLANIFPVNAPHRTMTDVDIEGWTIPKDTLVIGQMASVHLDPDMFTDPLQFNPDRFISPPIDSNKDKMETVIPFSLGKRQCLGESLARMELFLILATLLHKFTFKEYPEGKLPSLQGIAGVTLLPQPFSCNIVKR